MCSDSKVPPPWEKSDLTIFFDWTKYNQLVTYHNAIGAFNIVQEVDAVFKDLADNLNNIPKYETALFIFRAHSTFRAGIGLVMSGQVFESYPVFRSCIENALYGLYINQNEGSFDIWMNRHNNEESLKKVRSTFSYGNLKKFLEKWNKSIFDVATVLYERTIDFGGHPNERAFTSNLLITKSPGQIRIDTIYLTGDPQILMHGLKTGAQIGTCSLDIFQSLYKKRFDILCLSERLDELKSQL